MSQATTWGMQASGPAEAVAVADRINKSLNALLSAHSGTAAPTYAVDGTRWLDTSVAAAWAMKIYEGGAWLTEWVLNPTTNTFSDPNAVAKAPTGSILKSLLTSSTTYSTVTGVIPVDDTIPQISEGTQILSQAITPTATTSKIQGEVSVPVTHATSGSAVVVAMFRSGQANAIASRVINTTGVAEAVFSFEDLPASIAAVTYTVRVGSGAGTVYINGTSTTRLLGATMAATLLLQEVKA